MKIKISVRSEWWTDMGEKLHELNFSAMLIRTEDFKIMVCSHDVLTFAVHGMNITSFLPPSEGWEKGQGLLLH